MKERTDENPRTAAKLSRTSEDHREPLYEIPIRRADEQMAAHLFRDSLANSGKHHDVEENGDEKTFERGRR
jgi:hypothetical protein